MADTVQTLMERMVPELEELGARGIFLAEEIRKIVQQRRDFEYGLVKRSPDRLDYLRYVTFELNLDALRQVRKEKLGLRKTAMSDFAGQRRVHFIFDRALRRFRYDINMWNQWIEFCLKTNSTKALEKIFPRALRLLPREVDLWLQAAEWEHDVNQNMSGARHFMQRGLRLNPDCKRLWVQYFKLELLYVQKLLARRIVLGLDVDSLIENGAVNDAISTAHASSTTAEEEDIKPDTDESTQNIEQLSESRKAFFQGLVPRVIYNNAVEAIPKDVEFRAQFANIVASSRTPLPNGKALAFPGLHGHILESIATAFPSDAATWDLLARQHIVQLPEKLITSLAHTSNKDMGERNEEAASSSRSSTVEHSARYAFPLRIFKRLTPKDTNNYEEETLDTKSSGTSKRRQTRSSDSVADSSSSTTESQDATHSSDEVQQEIRSSNLNELNKAESAMCETYEAGLDVSGSRQLFEMYIRALLSCLQLDVSACASKEKKARKTFLLDKIISTAKYAQKANANSVIIFETLLRSHLARKQFINALTEAKLATTSDNANGLAETSLPWLAYESLLARGRRMLRNAQVASENASTRRVTRKRTRSMSTNSMTSAQSDYLLDLSTENDTWTVKLDHATAQTVSKEFKDAPSSVEILRQGILNVGDISDEAGPLYLRLTQILSKLCEDSDEEVTTEDVESTFLQGIRSCNSEWRERLRVEFISWVKQTGDVNKLYQLRHKLFEQKPSLSSFKYAMNMCDQLQDSNNERADKLQQFQSWVFEKCATDFGNSVSDIWIRWIQSLRSQNEFEEASRVYSRAIKTLQDASEFVEQITLLNVR